jgi:hypothetical protein
MGQITKPQLPVLRPKLGNPPSLILRPNQETHAPRLLMYNTERTQHHPTSRSSGNRVPDLCLTIPSPLHQVSYFCLDPRRCPPCRICHLHIMRQANTFIHTTQIMDRTTKISDIQIKAKASQLLITNQTKVLVTWFLNPRITSSSRPSPSRLGTIVSTTLLLCPLLLHHRVITSLTSSTCSSLVNPLPLSFPLPLCDYP